MANNMFVTKKKFKKIKSKCSFNIMLKTFYNILITVCLILHLLRFPNVKADKQLSFSQIDPQSSLILKKYRK